MTLSDHVRTLGRGPGRSRSLTQDEAQDAMGLMLSADAAPEAVGALLMLLRMKGETAEEIAGFAQAARSATGAAPQADLDWPSYAAGRTRGAPWFLVAARLVAAAGFRVVLHGWNGADTKVRAGLSDVGIQTATSLEQAHHALDRDGIVYLPLERLHPALFNLLNLRDVLGLRSCINTVCRMLNPCGAQSSVQGVFHPSYRLLQADAAQLMGWHNLTVIKGGGGEFERNPAKQIAGFGLRNGDPWDTAYPATLDAGRRLAEPTGPAMPERWQHQTPDPFEAEVILATAASALDTLGVADPARRAADLWDQMQDARAA